MSTFPRVGDVFGRYTITAQLGRGAMGVVFRATQAGLNRELALKVMPSHQHDDERFRRRFEQEAALLASVDSPHITQIHDFGEVDGCLFLVTQLVSDGDLAHRLRTTGPMSLAEAAHVGAQVARGLQDAHDAGVLHRDVKPSNVLVRGRHDRLHAYLCDFGVARRHESDLTTAGGVLGTYGYLAPECCMGEPASEASDVYAVGCLLVAMATGEAPYAGSELQVAQHHLSSPVPQVAGTDPETVRFNRVLERAMAKDPAQRFGDAAELATALDGVRAPGATPTRELPSEVTVVRRRGAGAPAAPAAPAAAPTGAGTPGDGTRSPVLARVTAACLVLAAVVALGSWAVVAGRDRSAADPVADGSAGTTAGKPSSGASASADEATADQATTPPSACWDGSAPRDGRCALPVGRQGLRWVFPAMRKGTECQRSDKDYKLIGWRCTYPVMGGVAAVTYSQYRSWRDTDVHYREDVNGGVSPRRQGDVIVYPVIAAPKDPTLFRASYHYRRPVPFAATATGPTRDVVRQGLEIALRDHRPLADFQQ